MCFVHRPIKIIKTFYEMGGGACGTKYCMLTRRQLEQNTESCCSAGVQLGIFVARCINTLKYQMNVVISGNSGREKNERGKRKLIMRSKFKRVKAKPGKNCRIFHVSRCQRASLSLWSSDAERSEIVSSSCLRKAMMAMMMMKSAVAYYASPIRFT